MRKPSQHLRKLIKSLNSQELKYIRQEISSNKELDSEQYLRMIDLIFQAEEPYEESLVRKKMKSGYFVTHFSQAKANLYELILKALNKYDLPESSRLKFLEKQAWSVILSDRGLVSNELQLVEHLQKEYGGSTHFLLNYQLDYAYTKSMIKLGDPNLQFDYAKKLEVDLDRRVDEYRLLLEMRVLFFKLFARYRKSGLSFPEEGLKEVDEWYRKVCSFPVNGQTSNEFLALYFYFLVICGYIKEDASLVYENINRQLQLAEEDYQSGHIGAFSLMRAQETMLGMSYAIRRWENMEKVYEQILKTTAQQQGKWVNSNRLRVNSTMRMYWLMSGKISRAVSNLENSEKDLIMDSDDYSLRSMWLYCRVMVFLADFNYPALEAEVLQLEQDLNLEISNDKFIGIRMCYLIAVFQQKDVVRLNSLLRSAIRYFEQKGIYDQPLKWFCEFLHKYRLEPQNARRLGMKQLLERIYETNETLGKSLFQNRVILFWLEAESEGVRVEELFNRPSFLQRLPR
jgi:hypothetical protein